MINQDFSINGLNLRQSPFTHGDLLRAVNVNTDYIGAKTKRSGYGTYLNSLGTRINTLFNWSLGNGTQFWNYAYAGGTLHYSTQGTGAWTVCGNGTFTGGSFIGHAVLNDTLILGDGVNATRHTTDGTSFTNTTLAPISEQFEEYQGRIWAIGTASYAFYSTTGTATDWATDSTSILIPSEGKNKYVYKVSDRLYFGKTSGLSYRWDGYSLVDLSTNLAYTSPASIAEVEGYKIGINRLGFYGNGGGNLEALSNPILRQIYNTSDTGIIGTSFDQAPATVYNYDYLCAVGTISDDLTNGTVVDAVLKYNIQLNEWLNWQFADYPTAMMNYKDTSGSQQLIWGDATGQCYQYAGTAQSDNGKPIVSEMMGFIHGGNFEIKEWHSLKGLFSPGSGVKIQYCITNTFRKEGFVWEDAGQPIDGVFNLNLSGKRGQFLFWRIYESSRFSRYSFYGWQCEFDIVKH